MKIEIQTTTGRREVKAITTFIPALVITYEPRGRDALSYTVTHQGSGQSIGLSVSTEQEARRIAAILDGLTDWTQSAAELQAEKGLNRRVVDALRR